MVYIKYTHEQVIASFWSRVDKSGGEDACWLWTGAIFKRSGYGQFSWHRISKLAHRVSWEIHNGEIPDGLQVLHNCPDGDNRACVNPAHLWLGTHKDNMADMKQKGRAATGVNNGHYLHPESYASGDDHWARRHPEWVYKGDEHWSHKQPERVLRGELNGFHKLTEAQVKEIRNRYVPRKVIMQSLAQEFGVSKQTIHRIVTNKAWTHLSGDET